MTERTATQSGGRVKEPTSGRVLEVLTEPGVQLYGKLLDGTITGRGPCVYKQRFGFCLRSAFSRLADHPEFPRRFCARARPLADDLQNIGRIALLQARSVFSALCVVSMPDNAKGCVLVKLETNLNREWLSLIFVQNLPFGWPLGKLTTCLISSESSTINFGLVVLNLPISRISHALAALHSRLPWRRTDP